MTEGQIKAIINSARVWHDDQSIEELISVIHYLQRIAKENR